MADEKVEKTKEAVLEAERAAEKKLKDADAGLDQGCDKIRDSRVGKALPTHIEKVEFSEILYMIILAIGITSIPIYLRLSDHKGNFNGETGFFYAILRFVRRISTFSFFVFGLGGVFLDFITVRMKSPGLLRIGILFKIAKTIIIIYTVIFINQSNLLGKILQWIYSGFIIVLDLLYIFYAKTYFKRLASDEFDDNGNPKNPKV